MKRSARDLWWLLLVVVILGLWWLEHRQSAQRVVQAETRIGELEAQLKPPPVRGPTAEDQAEATRRAQENLERFMAKERDLETK